MSKWHSLESDYMEVYLSYLIHLSKSASDHKYFVGVFTGRFKDILYFRDAFDNEIAVHIKDYLLNDGSFHIDFIPIKDVNDWAYDGPKNNKSELVKYNGVIKSIEKENDLVTCTALINKEKKFEIDIDDLNEFGKEHLLDTLMSGNTVQIEVKEHKDKLLPTLVAWCKVDD
jgi:hypothetical protein